MSTAVFFVVMAVIGVVAGFVLGKFHNWLDDRKGKK